MSKITLTDLANLQNENTAVNAINTNNNIIELAFDNTLSRDGTAPNQMQASLDMNSNRILNLPEPISTTEPVRLEDIATLSGGGTIIVTDTVGIRPEIYGAVGDGVHDDAPAINQAIAAVNAAGGGMVQLSAATYRLASFIRDTVLINLYSNVSIVGCGSSSILKVANGLNTGGQAFYVMMPNTSTSTSISNLLFKDFVIDFNGTNNGGFNYNNVGIGVYVGNNVTVDNVQFLNNPGSQNLVLGLSSAVSLSNVRVVNTYHYNCGGVINASCTDHSSVYTVADNYTLSNNVFDAPTQPGTGQSTAFEMHGSNGVASGNSVNNYGGMCNIAGLGGHGAANLVLSNNTIKNSVFGLALWNDGAQPVREIVITGNTFHQSIQHASSPYFNFNTTITATGTRDVNFSGNNFYSAVAAGTAGVVPTLSIGRIKGLNILDNSFSNGLGPVIGNGTLDATTQIRIESNSFFDSGQTSTAGGRRGILVNWGGSVVDSFRCVNNLFVNTSTVYMTTAMDVTLNANVGYIGPNSVRNVTNVGNFVLTGGFNSFTAAGVVFSQGLGSPSSATAQMTDGQLLVGATAGAPIPRTITGDVALTTAGVATSNTSTGPFTVTSNAATAMAVGPNGSTNPVVKVVGNTASQVAGLQVTGAATGGTVRVESIDSGANCNLTLASKGASGVTVLEAGGNVALFCGATQVVTGLPLLTSALGGMGYGPASNGSGGAVTQLTNRNTGVTLNKPTGAITLFGQVNSAVSGATASRFTVTNSTVAATDNIIINQKSGTDRYLVYVTTIAAGSFAIEYWSPSGGTTNESPIFSFSVIKGQIN